jgi:ADP-ribose pyrophosphatase YjhB (NUDIX family)
MTDDKPTVTLLDRTPIRFCTQCGGNVQPAIPADDDRSRCVCQTCGFVHYQNPKIVVGCIPTWQDRILLGKRSIDPRQGKWTLPAGYLENGETVTEGARRETVEEVQAEVGDLIPYALYNMPQIAQVYLMFRAPMLNDRCGAGSETLEVRLFEESEIPWDNIAFKVIRETLRRFIADRAGNTFSFHIGDIYFNPERR